MEKFKNNTKGITLVALVITIIILLILAGITISSLTNTGIFEKAKEARDKTANAAENQAKTLNEYEDELNKYISGTAGEKLADVVKVGDYVSYTPDTVSNTDIKYTTLISNLGTYSGSDANTTSTLTQENLKWRVLDVQNEQVRLISEVPTTSKIVLNGFNGYNNAVKLLDDTCSTLYNNSKLASKVQNLKIEDIEKKLATEINYNVIDYNPINMKYPIILEREKDQKVNDLDGKELGLSEQNEIIIQKEAVSAKTWKLKTTYYNYNITKQSFKNEQYYNLFGNTSYWLSSRCVNAQYDSAIFDVFKIENNKIDAFGVYASNGTNNTNSYSFRPVVTLNSNVQLDTTKAADGTQPNTAYEIK